MSEFSNGISPSESEVKKIIVGSPKIYQRTLNESEQRPKTIEVQQRNDRKEKLEILHQKPQSIDSEKSFKNVLQFLNNEDAKPADQTKHWFFLS